MISNNAYDEINLSSLAEYSIRNVRFEVFTAVIMKNGVFWVVSPWFLLAEDVG
jgi:hypothetical protein